MDIYAHNGLVYLKTSFFVDVTIGVLKMGELAASVLRITLVLS